MRDEIAPQVEPPSVEDEERAVRRRQINLIITLLDTAERTLNQAKLELLMLKRDLT